jgi:APA family basic amino acid/polyamine antiporter
MAEDRLFFPLFGRIGQRSRVPAFAIALQGIAAILIALSGSYGQILNYVVSVDFIWFGLTGAALFVFRRRGVGEDGMFRAPGHPLTTGFFVAACWMVVGATVRTHFENSLVGFAILAAGLPAFLWFRRRRPA